MSNPGLPDIDALEQLGGELTNYHDVVDGTTDLDAEFDNRNRMNASMMTHTAIRAWLHATLAATTGAIVLEEHDALWGNELADAPVVARTSTGIFTVTWPVGVNDELAREHDVNLRAGWGNARASAANYIVQVVRTTANVFTVYVRTDAGALTDAVGIGVDIFAL